MKRPIFIIIGTFIVLLLVGVWVYVLFFNNSTSEQETFTNLGLGDTTDPSYVAPTDETTNENAVVDVAGPDQLRQLTTRPVAGYQDIIDPSNQAPFVYYVERGTGHIFSIDLSSGEEKRISATTVPLTNHSAITSDGRFVMMQSGSGNSAQFNIGYLSSTSDNTTINPLKEKVVSFTDTTDNTFLYAVQTNNSVIGKEYDPETSVAKTIFTIPFREAIIVWGSSAKSTHLAYPKASVQLEGFVYQITNSKIERLPIDGYGLSAAGNNVGIIYSEQEKNQYKTYLYNPEDRASYPTLPTVIPEKCIALNIDQAIICAGSYTTHKYTLPDTWYQGAASFADDLFITHIDTGITEQLIGITKTTSQNLDIINLGVSADDVRIYFINSHDKNLWLYDRALSR